MARLKGEASLSLSSLSGRRREIGNLPNKVPQSESVGHFSSEYSLLSQARMLSPMHQEEGKI